MARVVATLKSLDYYGFSLLSYVQRICNSRFRVDVEELDIETETRLKRERIEGARKFLETRRSDPVDFSSIDTRSSIARGLDIAHCLFGGTIPHEGVAAIGDAALACGPGMVSILWSVSQWVPDRKRSALVMVDWRKRHKWLATSIAGGGSGGKSVGGVESSEVENYLITVDNCDCEELCLKFMDLVRERSIL